MSAPRVVTEGLGFIEAPRWRAGRLYYSDFSARTVSSVDVDGHVVRHAYVAGQPSGLGFTPDGALLVVSVHEGLLLRIDESGPSVFADIGSTYRGNLNDMLVDTAGGAYVSAFPQHVVGAATGQVHGEPSVPLLRVDPDGAVSVAADDLGIPNGIALTPDGRTLIVAETMRNVLTAFDVADDGRLSGRREFAPTGNRKPDGICLDADGAVWFGSPFTSEFVRVAEGGEVLAVVDTPGRWAVSCALDDGGSRLWCATVEVTLDQYRNGEGRGAIEVVSI